MFSLLLLAVLIAVLASSSVLATNFTIPFKFPIFKQCDQPWADDLMDTKTICSVGCLMTSTVMGLAGSNIPINGASADPRVLNTWLKANGGYDGSNDLIEGVVPKIDPSRIAWVRMYIYITYASMYLHIYIYIYTPIQYIITPILSFSFLIYIHIARGRDAPHQRPVLRHRRKLHKQRTHRYCKRDERRPLRFDYRILY